MFQAILFDLDNTLIDRQAAFRRYAIDFCRRRLLLSRPIEQQQALEQLMVADDWGYRSRDEFCEWVSAQFPGARLQPNDVWEDCCRHLPSFVQPDWSIRAMLSRLASRFQLLAITNGSGRNQHEKLRRAELTDCFSATIVSDEVGCEKPQPQIFNHALTIAGCSASEALVVGDDPRTDIGGAKQSGLSAYWVSHGRRYPEGMAQPDRVLASVLDLERCLV